MASKVFRPKRMASWWCSVDDLLWPEGRVLDKIKRRAEGFAKANIDTAINFGFHARFDFSNYFGSLHGYYRAVCDELHQYGIRFMDHYSCNIVERPRGHEEFEKMHAAQRHHILLHPDEQAAAFAQYEGHFFRDLCEEDFRDGSRGYTWSYQGELFCHNNPEFMDMHEKYLKRLISEVPMDGIEVDDMCDYAYLTTCGCRHCREKFYQRYGHRIPPMEDHSFWGSTQGHPTTWGNYENPVFREWIRFKADSVLDHVKMIRGAVGDLPLMTCCSSTGPLVLNTLGLDLERLSPYLDLFMLENCGTNIKTVNWSRMDAEALQQKDIAKKRGNAPAIALSYSTFPDGSYFGWSLSRFWGVGNWASTLFGRFEKEPEEKTEIHSLIEHCYTWEKQYSDLDIENGEDLVEVRLVSSSHCKNNGWRDEQGEEHWDKVTAWSKALLENNIGYRFLRAGELGDQTALLTSKTPIILDGVGCVSDAQYDAISAFLADGGSVFLRLPFGSHDGKGYRRSHPLSEDLLAKGYPGLILLDRQVSPQEHLKHLIRERKFNPIITQLSGDPCWSLRLRKHPDGTVLHLMNRAMEAVPSEEYREYLTKIPVLKELRSQSQNNRLEYQIHFPGAGSLWKSANLLSPELEGLTRRVSIETLDRNTLTIGVNMDDITVYGVVSEN